MFRENCKINQNDAECINVGEVTSDGHSLKMTGQIIDKIYENGVLVHTIVGHNLVVDSCMKLFMSLLKKQTGYTGVQYWAIGSGSSSWDTNMPNPESNATRLTSEIGRIAISGTDMDFLNADLSVSTSPTNILQIKHTFGVNDCNGTWREFGIFGGNATTAANSGIMINKRHHQIITKTSSMTIERTMRFTLNLV